MSRVRTALTSIGMLLMANSTVEIVPAMMARSMVLPYFFVATK
ncbi:hypothetical protein [Arthrobacter castelli]|nr:hypothetical protein [Arthrobacter castelli]